MNEEAAKKLTDSIMKALSLPNDPIKGIVEAVILNELNKAWAEGYAKGLTRK